MILLFVAGFLFATLSFAQIYNGKHQDMAGPMDRAGAQHDAMWANVANAGDSEWSGSADQRYTNMTTPFNAANQRHFDTTGHYHTVNELFQGLPEGELK